MQSKTKQTIPLMTVFSILFFIIFITLTRSRFPERGLSHAHYSTFFCTCKMHMLWHEYAKSHCTIPSRYFPSNIKWEHFLWWAHKQPFPEAIWIFYKLLKRLNRKSAKLCEIESLSRCRCTMSDEQHLRFWCVYGFNSTQSGNRTKTAMIHTYK